MKINDYTLDSIRNNYLFFSHPADFNDPFDSCINEEFVGTNGKVDYRIVSPDTILTCCFSEILGSILMWSHYADSHKGICLIFKTRTKGNSLGIAFDDPRLKTLPPENQDFLPAEKVDYQEKMLPSYNILKNKNDSGKIMKFLLRKCKDWEYEKEWRLIIPESGISTREIQFKKSSLVGVIFGMDTPKSEEQRVRKIVQEYYKGIKISFFKSKPIAGKYVLDIIDDN